MHPSFGRKGCSTYGNVGRRDNEWHSHQQATQAGTPARHLATTARWPCPSDTHPAVIPAGHSDSRDRDCCCSVLGFKFADDFVFTAGWDVFIKLCHGCPCPQNQVSLGFINRPTQVPTAAEAKSF